MKPSIRILTVLIIAAGSTSLAYAGSCCGMKDGKTTKAETKTHAQKPMAASTEQEQPRLYVVKLHADWCGTCQAIKTQYEAAKKHFKGQPVKFMTFDVTNDETRKASLKKAEKLGIADTLKKTDSMGRVLVIDAESGKVLNTLKGKKDADRYVTVISADLNKQES